MTRILEALQDMRARLLEDGWCQGMRTNAKGQRCLLGLMQNYGQMTEENAAFRVVTKRCRDILGDQTITDPYNGWARGVSNDSHDLSVLAAVNNVLLDENSVGEMINSLIDEEETR